MWVSIALIASGCSPVEDISPGYKFYNSWKPTAIQQENGYLVFKSEEHVFEILGELTAMPDSIALLVERESGFKSFYTCYREFATQVEQIEYPSLEVYLSLLNEYSDIVYLDKDSFPRMRFFNQDFARIVNREGLIKIGERMAWIGFDKWIYFSPDQIANLPSIKRAKPQELSPSITFIPIIHVDPSLGREECGLGAQPEPIYIVGGVNPQGPAITNTVISSSTVVNDRNRSLVLCQATQWWYPNSTWITVSLSVTNQRRTTFWFGHKAGVNVTCSIDLTSNRVNFGNPLCNSFPNPVPTNCFITFSANNYTESMAQDISNEWSRSIVSPFAGAPFSAPPLDIPTGIVIPDPPFFWTQVCVDADIVSDFKTGPNVVVSL